MGLLALMTPSKCLTQGEYHPKMLGILVHKASRVRKAHKNWRRPIQVLGIAGEEHNIWKAFMN
jgi:hypothetical protein